MNPAVITTRVDDIIDSADLLAELKLLHDIAEYFAPAKISKQLDRLRDNANRRIDAERITMIYDCPAGYTQPLKDIPECGTLTDDNDDTDLYFDYAQVTVPFTP